MNTQHTQTHNANCQVFGALVHAGAPVALLLSPQITIKIACIGNDLSGQIQTHIAGKLLIHHTRDGYIFWYRPGPEDMINPGSGRSNTLQLGKLAENSGAACCKACNHFFLNKS